MRLKVINKIIVFILIYIILFTINCYAGSFSITATPTTVEPNAKVTIKITGNNATGRINLSGSNISLSASSVWVENNTQTITGTITGTSGNKATITATPAVDNLVDSTTADTITGSKSATVTIKKEEPKQEIPPQTTPSTNTGAANNGTSTNNNQSINSSAKPTTSTTNKKNNTTNKTTTKTDKTTTTKKEDTVQNQYVEDQGTISEFGITSLYIQAINKNDEKSEIEISPKFDINTSEYTCNVTENIKNVEIIYEANEYKDLVKIEGLENELIPGENIITLKMNDNNGKEKIYKITVIKEEPEIIEVISEELIEEKAEEKEEEKGIIKMPISWFVALQTGIILINILVSIIVYKTKKKKWLN